MKLQYNTFQKTFIGRQYSSHTHTHTPSTSINENDAMVPGQTMSCAISVRYMNMLFIMKYSPGNKRAMHTVACTQSTLRTVRKF